MKFIIFFFVYLFFVSCSLFQEKITNDDLQTIKKNIDNNAYELLFQIYCNNKWETTTGYYYCQQEEGLESKIRFVFPPIPGNFRISSCRKDVVPPENFNPIQEKGHWIFKKRTFTSNIAEISLGKLKSDSNNCPIVISVMSDVGIQKALIVYQIWNLSKPKYSIDFEYTCGNVTTKKEGVGSCSQYANTYLSGKIKLPTNKGKNIINIISRDCGIKDKIKNLEIKPEIKFEYKLPNKICILDFGVTFKKKKDDLKGSILFIGYNPNWRGLGKPQIKVDKKYVTIFKPAFAKYLYVNNKRVTEEKIVFKRKKIGNIIKAYSWSANPQFFGAFSYIIYDINRNKEIKGF